MPKLRDKLVLEAAIRDTVGKLDPQFGCAESFDPATGRYQNLILAKNAPEILGPNAVIVRDAEARVQIDSVAPPEDGLPGSDRSDVIPPANINGGPPPRRPRRFYGSVELDMARPVKAFDAVLNAVVMELQRTPGTNVKLPLEIEGEAAQGFADEEISVVRDNARQLKFRPGATGFGE